jgi:hypothetical protein
VAFCVAIREDGAASVHVTGGSRATAPSDRFNGASFVPVRVEPFGDRRTSVTCWSPTSFTFAVINVRFLDCSLGQRLRALAVFAIPRQPQLDLCDRVVEHRAGVKVRGRKLLVKRLERLDLLAVLPAEHPVPPWDRGLDASGSPAATSGPCAEGATVPREPS